MHMCMCALIVALLFVKFKNSYKQVVICLLLIWPSSCTVKVKGWLMRSSFSPKHGSSHQSQGDTEDKSKKKSKNFTLFWLTEQKIAERYSLGCAAKQ